MFTRKNVTWIFNTTDYLSKIKASEMKFLGILKGCIRMDHITNNSTHFDLNVYNISRKIKENQINERNL